MEAKELRIGNYIKSHDEIIEVSSIEDGIKSNIVSCVCGYANIGDTKDVFIYGIEIGEVEPIPLTEEILLSCGFEKIDTKNIPLGYYYAKFPICIIPNESGNDIEIMDNDYSINMGNNSPKYLHQLQNLYFALTGKELEINL